MSGLNYETLWERLFSGNLISFYMRTKLRVIALSVGCSDTQKRRPKT